MPPPPVLAGKRLIVVDVEGNGQQPPEIVELAAVPIEDGVLGRPLREMTVASTLLDVLRSVTELGSDLRFFPFGGSLGAPTILVGEMTVGGT